MDIENINDDAILTDIVNTNTIKPSTDKNVSKITRPKRKLDEFNSISASNVISTSKRVVKHSNYDDNIYSKKSKKKKVMSDSEATITSDDDFDTIVDDKEESSSEDEADIVKNIDKSREKNSKLASSGKIYAHRLVYDHLILTLPNIFQQTLIDCNISPEQEIQFTRSLPDNELTNELIGKYKTLLSTDKCVEVLKRYFKKEPLLSENPSIHEMDIFYLVKLNDRSFAHCVWFTRSELIHEHVDGEKMIKIYEKSLENKDHHVDAYLKELEELSNKHESSKLKIATKIREQNRRVKLCKENGQTIETINYNEALDTIEKKYQASRCAILYRRSSKVHSYSNGSGFFNPDFCKVDRIIYEREENNADEYLVKWCSLGYYESTWETEELLDDINGMSAIEKYNAMLESRPTCVKPPKKLAKELISAPCTENTDYKGLRLFKYQVVGVNWMAYNFLKSRSVILADEMGLGKTAQIIAFLDYLKNKASIQQPFLVVAPMSTLMHWRREIERFTDMYAVVYHGTPEDKKIIRDTEFQDKVVKDIYRFEILITSYDTLITDLNILRKIKFSHLVLDEAQRIKNIDCNLRENLLHLKFDYSILLTGTPIQNDMTEFWSLLNFVDPDNFNSLSKFLEVHGKMETTEQIDKLTKEIGPYILRRLKSEVQTDLLPKEEKILEVYLTKIQKKYYKAVYEKNIGVLKGKGVKSVISLRNICMQLRKCCIHPYLLESVESEVSVSGLNSMEQLINASGKMILLDKLLPKLKSTGHKTLIFSQMTRVLDILQDYCDYKNYQVERIDGKSDRMARQESIDRFNLSEGSFICLVSTKAGGVGLSLTAADTVILFDSDWNPQGDIQAQARCHRIGQTKPVIIYRLLTRDTYEMEMFHCASRKLGLDQAIMQSVEAESKNRHDVISKDSAELQEIQSSLFKSSEIESKDELSEKTLSKDELEKMLKYGAYAIADDEEYEKKINEFCDEDIDQILMRSETIKIDDGSNKANFFSKVSFVTNGDSENLDINDDMFWQKLGLQEVVEQNAKADNILPENTVRSTRLRAAPRNYFENTSKDDFSNSKYREIEEDYYDDSSSFRNASDGTDEDDVTIKDLLIQEDKIKADSKSKPRSKVVVPKESKPLQEANAPKSAVSKVTIPAAEDPHMQILVLKTLSTNMRLVCKTIFPTSQVFNDKLLVHISNLDLIRVLNIIGALVPFSIESIKAFRSLPGIHKFYFDQSWLSVVDPHSNLQSRYIDIHHPYVNRLLNLSTEKIKDNKSSIVYVEIISSGLIFPWLADQTARGIALNHRQNSIELLVNGVGIEKIKSYADTIINNNDYQSYLWRVLMQYLDTANPRNINTIKNTSIDPISNFLNDFGYLCSQFERVKTFSNYFGSTEVSLNLLAKTPLSVNIPICLSLFPINSDLPRCVWREIPLFPLIKVTGNELAENARSYAAGLNPINKEVYVEHKLDIRYFDITPFALLSLLSKLHSDFSQRQKSLIQIITKMAGSYHFELSTSVLVFKKIDVIVDKNIADLILMIVVVLQKITLIWDEILHLFCEFQRSLYSIVKVNRDVLLYKQLLNSDFSASHEQFISHIKRALPPNLIAIEPLNKCFKDIIDQSTSFGRERVMQHFINSILTECDDRLENIMKSLEIKFPSYF